MTIQTNAVSLFRAEWVSRFVDSCVIARTTDRGTYNQTTHEYDSPTEPTQYTGDCLVRPGGPGATVFGEKEITTHAYYVLVPYTVDGIEPEDRVTVTSDDTDLDGKVLIVESIGADSYVTHRILGCRLDQDRGNP